MSKYGLILSWAGSVIMLFLFAVPVYAVSNRTPGLTIDGASPALTENIRAYIGIDSESCSFDRPQRLLFVQRLNRDVHQAAKALGFYHLEYASEFIDKDGCWNLHLQVRPGEPVRVNRIDVQVTGSGEQDNAFRKYLADELPVNKGDKLDHSRYEKIKSDLSGIAISRGYFDAEFDVSELRINVGENVANIIIHYDTGQRLSFGEIRFPETVLSEEMLLRYRTFESGSPYNIEQVDELQSVLDDSQYFSRVRVEPKLDETVDGQVPVNVELTPRKQHAFSFGAGASTDTGPRVRFGYENRYLNAYGHRLNYDLTLSPVRSETKLDYKIPLSKPATRHLDLYTGILTEETDSSEQDTFTLGAGYTMALGNNWAQTIFLNYEREDFLVADVEETTDLLMPGVSWTKVKSDDPLYPLRGWRLYARFRTADEALGSDVSFYQTTVSAKTITKWGPGRMLLRVDAGATAVDDFNALPASVRFFAGGDNSVRGYDYESLGPVDENGEVIGGANLLVGSAEYDFRIGRQWSFAVFYDIGNAFDQGEVDYKRGTGFGLRWLSPVGPIRIDVASALDNDNEIRLHLSMGPDL